MWRFWNQRLVRSDATLASSSSGSMGFASSSQQCPSARAFSTSSLVYACPEKSKISQLGYFFSIAEQSSMPVIPGMITSEMTQSGMKDSLFLSAAFPSYTAKASWPSPCRINARVSATNFSSSTTRTRILRLKSWFKRQSLASPRSYSAAHRDRLVS